MEEFDHILHCAIVDVDEINVHGKLNLMNEINNIDEFQHMDENKLYGLELTTWINWASMKMVIMNIKKCTCIYEEDTTWMSLAISKCNG